ncbi:DUF1761 domain-containing protein (plasmid) [Pseudoalteromonas xiamenensis]|uniref:DUF1761 domain-containing protein n=1 Tax=Pseudoalteromonas xiamenensis TaxID=882626 RepID=UPI0027E4E699|nr:DUF1761 domain-containing protein [Pseudoalteromonas xiamenensis]WMN62231.1 DUF1761 domain-containing protein [Pseudoalteromonas xiamenensis]
MGIDYLNWFAVFVAAGSSFLLGGIWYSPWLFQRAWMEECGLTELDLKQSDAKKTFGGSFLLTLLASVMLGIVLGPEPQLGKSVLTGLIIGVCWVASSFGVSYLFEQRSRKLFLINGGYHVFQFITMGLVIGLFG